MKWFRDHGREFPWRVENLDPFISLVTELLLQRTKASSVATFFPTIIEKYSTPDKIMDTPETELLDDLQPLGLQKRRSESLHAIARQILEDHKGLVPVDEVSLLNLKGVGKYIARAVLCFSRNKPISIVDVNVTRLFCRFFGMENKGDNRRNTHIWEKSSDIIQLLNPNKVKDFNWAILDFAALTCTPAKPHCTECVLKKHCTHFKRKNNE
ncbi:MAG: hypothetical protein ACTSUE_06885 [Promethearchaeota archaeon]